MNQIVNIPLEDATPEIGDLAINEEGALGVITSSQLQKLNTTGTFKSYVAEKVFVGVHISNDYAPKGSPWQSRKPTIVGCVSDAKAFVEGLQNDK
jgi:hypothetical protein